MFGIGAFAGARRARHRLLIIRTGSAPATHRRENASGFLIGWLPFAHLGVMTKTQRQQLFRDDRDES
jgi:hypothetical protein